MYAEGCAFVRVGRWRWNQKILARFMDIYISLIAALVENL